MRAFQKIAGLLSTLVALTAITSLIPATHVLADSPPDNGSSYPSCMTAEEKAQWLKERQAALGTTVLAVNEQTKTVGVEWVEDYSDAGFSYLQYSQESATTFYDRMGTAGWTKEFNFGDSLAWERDFKESGDDDLVADSVDIVWFDGHGSNGVFCFDDLYHDDPYLHYYEASWGDNQLEWVFLKACSVLADKGVGSQLKSGGKFAQALQGAHLVCGCASIVTSDARDGENVAEYLTGQDGKTAAKVWQAWGKSLRITQDATDELVVLAEHSNCLDDYIWGVSTGPANFPGADSYYYGLWWQAGDS